MNASPVTEAEPEDLLDEALDRDVVRACGCVCYCREPSPAV